MRVSVLIVLPTGALDRPDGVSAEVVDNNCVNVTFIWPKVIANAGKLMDAILSFCPEMGAGRGTLLAQGLSDFCEPLQNQEGDDIRSTCRITLPFPVKPDFQQDVMRFDDNSTALYLLRFSAFDRKFAIPKQQFTIWSIQNAGTDLTGRTVGTAEHAGEKSTSDTNNSKCLSSVTH